MKKFFSFIAVAAIAAIAMTGCKKPVETQTVTISLSKSAIEIGVDETYRLQATVTPANANAKVTFKSQDNSIATISGSGLVTGKALGETSIVATIEGIEGIEANTVTCKIMVSDMAYYNNFTIIDYGLFGEFTPIQNTEDTLVLTNGDTVVCDLEAISYVIAWDGGANYVAGQGIVGDGFVCQIENVPFYVILENLTTPGYAEGYYLGAGGFAARKLEEGEPLVDGVADIGQMDIQSCGDLVAAQYSSDTTLHPDFVTWGELNYGALLSEPFANGLGTDYGFLTGKINKILFLDAVKSRVNPTEDSILVRWAIDVDMASIQADRLWGFRYDTAHYAETYVEGEGGDIVLSQPYDYLTVNRVFDEDGLFGDDENAAPARRLLSAKRTKNARQLGDRKKLHLGVTLDKNGKEISTTTGLHKK